MTILAKPSITIHKAELKAPLDDCDCPEEKIDLYPPKPVSQKRRPRRRYNGSLCIMAMVALAVLIIGGICGKTLYRQYLMDNNSHYYHAYCSVPIEMPESEDQLIESNYHRVMPLPWSLDPDVQVISTADEETTRKFVNSVRERFDIRGRVEKVSVLDNGRTINFIHDFDENVTDIVDQDRCFTMDLDPEMVVPPELLVVSIERNAEFDVSAVHSALRAVLPALRELGRRARLRPLCGSRPVYRLQRDEGPRVRKRSADALPHDYRQFSGKHVQHIEITNLQELLDYEKNHA